MNTYIVNESSKNIRTLARQSLKGLWKPAILAVLIFTICTMVPSMLFELIFDGFSLETIESSDTITTGSAVSAIYSLLVTGPFALGITVFFLDLVRDRKTDVGQVFSGFGLFFKTFGLMIVMGIFIALWTCLLIVPGIIAAIRYSQAFYVLADDPEKGIMQCIRESKEMMKGNKGKYFCLQLSFIGWYLLVFLALMIFAIGTVAISIIFPGFADTVGVILTSVGIMIFAVLADIFLVPYIQSADTVFYEMANGNLRPESEELPPLSQAGFELKVDDNLISENKTDL